MKNLYLTVFGLFCIGAFAQNNVFPVPTGNAGVGTSTPVEKFEVVNYRQSRTPPGTHKYAFFGEKVSNFPATGVTYSGLYFEQSYASPNYGFTLRSTSFDVNQGYMKFTTLPTPNTTIGALSFGYNTSEFLRINQDGKVRISATDIATPDGYRLFVEDGILTEKVKVAISSTSDWADYVFADNYELMPLEEVEQFTKENKHLPNVPCAEDMVTEGLDVAQMDARLLEKIEELTLYLIEQNKKLEEQNKKIETLQTELQQLKEQQD